MNRFYHSEYFNFALYGVFFILPIMVWLPIILSGTVPISGDGISHFISMTQFIQEAFSYREMPTWIKYLSAGTLNGDIMKSLLYLPSTVFMFLPIEFYVLFLYSFHLSIGAFFTYLYLRKIGVNKLTAIAFALIYEFSIHLGGFRKSHIMLIAAAVWLPVILYFIESYFTDKKLSDLVLAVFALSLPFAAFLQYGFYIAVVVVVYTLALEFKYKISLKKFIKDSVVSSALFIGFVSISILPASYAASVYNTYGTVAPTIDFFKSYSISAIKLIFLFSPTSLASGNIFQAGGTANSSEMDIEIFIGIILFFTIYSVIRYFRDFRVKLFIIIAVFCFAFAANVHISHLSELLYNVPIVNGFRVPSRILFIFTFFLIALAAIGVSKIREESELEIIYKDMIKLLKYFILFLIIAGICGLLLFDVNLSLRHINETILKKVLLRDLLILVLVPALLILLYSFVVRKYKNLRTAAYLCLLLAIVTAVQLQTLRFNLQNNGSAVANILKNRNNSEFQDGMFWVASPSYEYLANISIGSNIGLISKTSSLNSYNGGLNNPLLYRMLNNNIFPPYNYSGLYVNFPNAYKILMEQNSLVSMLGVKYIIDPRNYLDNQTTLNVTGKYKSKEPLDYSYPKFADYGNNIFGSAEKISISSNEFIKIDFDLEYSDNIKWLYIDLYGGQDYDLAETDRTVHIDKNHSKYSILLNSNKVPNNIKDVFLRFIANTPLDIKNVNISKLIPETQPSPYKYFKEFEGYKTYINENAKPILYKPEYLSNIKDFELIYSDVYSFDLTKTSYIEAEEKDNLDLTKVTTEISDILFTTNKISAKVVSSGDSFVNFSQVYFPGWKSYIDGIESEVYMVNGLIMGTKVPAGEHTIELKFTFNIMYVALAIFCVSFLIMLFIVIRSFRMDRKTSKDS